MQFNTVKYVSVEYLEFIDNVTLILTHDGEIFRYNSKCVLSDKSTEEKSLICVCNTLYKDILFRSNPAT